MKYSTIYYYAIVFVLLFASCTNKKEEINRYQLLTTSSSEYTQVYLVDTKTGTVWREMDIGQWINLGNPPTEAKERGSMTKTVDY